MSVRTDDSAAWFAQVASSPSLEPLAANVQVGGASSARSARGSSTTFVAAALAARCKRPLLLVTAHLDEADEAYAELADLHAAGQGGQPALLPALEAPGEGGAALTFLRAPGSGALPARWHAAGSAGGALRAAMQMVPDAALLARLMRAWCAWVTALIRARWQRG
ncbi:MAG: hypothetical protein U0636_13280 [Phycisphaerales bacterium]